MNKYLIVYNDYDSNFGKNHDYAEDVYTYEIVESTDVSSLMHRLARERLGEKSYGFLKKAFDECVKTEDYVDVFNNFAFDDIEKIFVISSTVYSES